MSRPSDDQIELTRQSTERPDDTADVPPENTADDDVDASEYVRQLIERMGNSSAGRPVGAAKPSAPQDHRATGDADASSRNRSLPLGNAPESLDELTRLQKKRNGALAPPKHAQPATRVDLAKLREAANITTTSVLHAFDCNGLIRRAYGELAVAVVCMVTSLALVTMSHQVPSLAFNTSAVMLIAAGTATYRYSKTTRTLGQKLRGRR